MTQYHYHAVQDSSSESSEPEPVYEHQNQTHLPLHHPQTQPVPPLILNPNMLILQAY